MARRKQDPEYGCSIEVTLDVIGGKWKGMVLHRLLDGPARFNELRRLAPKATQRVMTLQLRELERDGVISRTVYPEVPPKVEYALTDFGSSLAPMLKSMSEWGDRYHKLVRARTRQAENLAAPKIAKRRGATPKPIGAGAAGVARKQ